MKGRLAQQTVAHTLFCAGSALNQSVRALASVVRRSFFCIAAGGQYIRANMGSSISSSSFMPDESRWILGRPTKLKWLRNVPRHGCQREPKFEAEIEIKVYKINGRAIRGKHKFVGSPAQEVWDRLEIGKLCHVRADLRRIKDIVPDDYVGVLP